MAPNPKALVALALAVGCLALVGTAVPTRGWLVNKLTVEGVSFEFASGLFNECVESIVETKCQAVVEPVPESLASAPVCAAKPHGMTYVEQNNRMVTVQAFAVVGAITALLCCICAAARAFAVSAGTTKQQVAGGAVALTATLTLLSQVTVWGLFISTMNYCGDFCEAFKQSETASLPAGTPYTFSCGLNYSFGLSVAGGVFSLVLIVLGVMLLQKESTTRNADPSSSASEAGLDYQLQQ